MFNMVVISFVCGGLRIRLSNQIRKMPNNFIGKIARVGTLGLLGTE